MTPSTSQDPFLVPIQSGRCLLPLPNPKESRFPDPTTDSVSSPSLPLVMLRSTPSLSVYCHSLSLRFHRPPAQSFVSLYTPLYTPLSFRLHSRSLCKYPFLSSHPFTLLFTPPCLRLCTPFLYTSVCLHVCPSLYTPSVFYTSISLCVPPPLCPPPVSTTRLSVTYNPSLL